MNGSFKGRSIKQSYDWKLVFCYILLVIIGLINIYASIHSSEPTRFLDWNVRSGKQFIWILTGIGLAASILFLIPPRLWEGGALIFYIFVILLLIAVIFLGIEVKGSKSWFEFGPVRFQPAEISKISTSLLLAFVMSRPKYKLSEIKYFALTAFIIALPMMIILAESETGSALVYTGFIFMLYREGLSGWFLILIGVAILLFILTLTASPYISILVLLGIATFCNALNSGKIGKWLIIYGSFILIMSFFPMFWHWLCETIAPEAAQIAGNAAEAARDNLDDNDLLKNIAADHRWGWLIKINPVYFLLAAFVPTIPIYFHKEYINKDIFNLYSIIATIGGLILIFSTSFIFDSVLQDHQRKRIEILLGMKEDPAGVGYNVNQSMIAIGSGGLFGKGFLKGTQTTYGFVPEQSTDFIFCTIGEEWGFAGCTLVIMLYVFMIWRIITDAEKSRRSFTRIYGYCVVSCLFMHLFINIGMTIGIMPVIGIPLPLLSYGGSSLWAFTIMIFIFIVLDHEEKKYF
ncbi:MAG: rod shape-determining protein RodA [Candidatus Cryptobacteroides sp.]